MNNIELKSSIIELEAIFADVSSSFDKDSLVGEIASLESQTRESSFWNDQRNAQAVIQQLNSKKELISMYAELTDIVDTLRLAYELATMDEDFDLSEIPDKITTFRSLSDELLIKLLLNKPFDHLSAIIEFHPGAGGTESQDWAEMLMRMYLRWAEQHKFKTNVVDYQVGDEAGLKSATVLVEGNNAFGYLKCEAGVHRLVRISPFDAAARRHTSFASVTVTPEIDETITIEIADADIRVDTYRSSGNGGQGVNTTDSAVRITHLPTKIIVTCQNERSQIQNRETAMRILKGKLYQLELEKKQNEIDKLNANRMANAFGSQIRSYVFHPYAMVKDHRTDVETGNVAKVMDGGIDFFINAYLKNYRS